MIRRNSSGNYRTIEFKTQFAIIYEEFDFNNKYPIVLSAEVLEVLKFVKNLFFTGIVCWVGFWNNWFER
jgi:hypothetical protein